MICDHCGRTCGNFEGGYSSLSDSRGEFNFCHPNAPGRPDCYHLVTVMGEPIGSRLPTDLYDVALRVTDETLGAGTYAHMNAGNRDPGVEGAIARWAAET